ncbi:hypothetical protein QP915_05995 [Corynebacterium sp. MSK158]|nr:hypothetical protein [Corynebacterium sp. MSK158]
MIETWRREIPGEAYAHGQIWTQASASDGRKHPTPNTMTHFQYSYDRARRSLRGIKEQVAKAKRAVDGEIAIKRNRYFYLSTPNKKVNYALAAKHRTLAGIKGYETDLTALPAQEVIGHYRRLFHIENVVSDVEIRPESTPNLCEEQNSITAHLNIVMAALAVAHLMETRSGHFIKRLVRTLKKYRSFQFLVGGETIHAAVPLPARPHRHHSSNHRPRTSALNWPKSG